MRKGMVRSAIEADVAETMQSLARFNMNDIEDQRYVRDGLALLERSMNDKHIPVYYDDIFLSRRMQQRVDDYRRHADYREGR